MANNTFILIIRALLFYAGFYLTLIFFSVTAPILFGFMPFAIRSRYVLLWNKFTMVWLRICCGVKVNIVGAENIPAGAAVFQSNHQSQWETIFLQTYLAPVCFVLKRELLNVPFFGWGLRLMDPIAINRGSPKKALKETQQQGIERLGRGISVLIFPEGTRLDPGQKKPYARGGSNLAIAAEAAVVPVAHNAGHFWPADKFIKYPGTITVSIGKALDAKDAHSKALTAEIQAWIETEVAGMN